VISKPRRETDYHSVFLGNDIMPFLLKMRHTIPRFNLFEVSVDFVKFGFGYFPVSYYHGKTSYIECFCQQSHFVIHISIPAPRLALGREAKPNFS